MRAVDTVRAYEVSRDDLLPIVERRPEILLAMSLLLAARQAELRDKSDHYLFSSDGKSRRPGRLARMMKGFLLR